MAVTRILDQLGVESRPTSIFRMGRRPDNLASRGPRLLKVTFPARVFQHVCLGGWKRERDRLRAQPGLGRMFIRPSLTKAQRDQERVEREQKRRRPSTTGPFTATQSLLTSNSGN